MLREIDPIDDDLAGQRADRGLMGELAKLGLTEVPVHVARGLSPEQLKKYLFGAKMVRCDETAWSMWGISMAGWNALLSAALAFVLSSGVASWVRSRA